MLHTGVVLAGGRSVRMGGGHKFLREIAGVTMFDRVVERLRPQVDLLVMSAASSLPRFDSGLTVVTDLVADGGPLAGLHAAAAWAERTVGPKARIVTVPADTPFIPRDLVPRFRAAISNDANMIAVASSPSGTHHAVASWPVRVTHDLDDWFAYTGSRSIRDFLATQVTGIVPFNGFPDPFFNVNTPAELDAAMQMAESMGQ